MCPHIKKYVPILWDLAGHAHSPWQFTYLEMFCWYAELCCDQIKRSVFLQIYICPPNYKMDIWKLVLKEIELGILQESKIKNMKSDQNISYYTTPNICWKTLEFWFSGCTRFAVIPILVLLIPLHVNVTLSVKSICISNRLSPTTISSNWFYNFIWFN